ncbi:5-methylcytosine-specific restriction endonuclease McrBC, regulatory subunit McrC [Thiothrix caldifontis]|uniref:5-methylcytosine-specific restriction endonuclease McrBC, regulatory subunit McrC n=1 Tax=Thiothrix caldifontis TaxID=525918 RepID=A0A1H4BXV6_9GAMM|nr:hypothetical protein [Thiothrix caldifontis]SEA52919.1 5-methylcytosine-specific restriction endonuclease McrBC, regulatory subunit McrC [Thiothrix caldifontis]
MMTLKNLHDNGNISIEISDLDRTVLEKYSAKSIDDFAKMGVHVVSTEANEAGSDESNKLSLFSLSGNKINTNNCMGVVRLYDDKTKHPTLIRIKSRFDENDKQLFLTYLLSKVFGGSFVSDSIPSDDDSIWDILLAFIFRKTLKDACAVGLFKQYQTFENNDLRYRGKFNIDSHIKINTPFLGKIAYTTKDITFDNPTNHLIRHAINKINKKWAWILSNDSELLALQHAIEQHTPSWSSENLVQCMYKKENRHPIKHPFFASFYEPLRKLSFSILRNSGASLYDAGSHEAEGVIFDGSWLWEEYINTLLIAEGFIHPRNKTGKNPIYLFEKSKYRRYPDFYKENIILDAKYKKMNNLDKIERNDIHQIISYMFVQKAQLGGFIYPIQNETSALENIGLLNGYGGSIKIIPFKIPETDCDHSSFIDLMKTSEQSFIESIRKCQE